MCFVVAVPGLGREWPQWLDPSRSAVPWYFAFAWLLTVVAVSVLYRLTRGKPLLRPRVPDALFSQNWCSGRSLRNVVTRLGGASGCLWVTVTRDELLVGSHFPFTLMFLPEIYGLE